MLACAANRQALEERITDEFQLVIVEAFVSEQLLQEGHDLARSILVCLRQVDVPQIKHNLAWCLQQEEQMIEQVCLLQVIIVARLSLIHQKLLLGPAIQAQLLKSGWRDTENIPLASVLCLGWC